MCETYTGTVQIGGDRNKTAIVDVGEKQGRFSG